MLGWPGSRGGVEGWGASLSSPQPLPFTTSDWPDFGKQRGVPGEETHRAFQEQPKYFEKDKPWDDSDDGDRDGEENDA